MTGQGAENRSEALRKQKQLISNSGLNDRRSAPVRERSPETPASRKIEEEKKGEEVEEDEDEEDDEENQDEPILVR